MKITDRKTEIINVAAKLFKEKGYSAVTMRDIAQAMDIKAASLYNHIKSKQEILVLIVIEIAEEFTTTMNEVVNSNETTIKKIERIIQLHIDITLRDANALACLNNDWMHLADAELTYFIKMREDYEENFRTIIKKGIADGEIKNLNLEVIIFSTLSTLRTLYLWYGKKKSPDPAVLKSNMIKVLLNGIVVI
ncbi:TetR/AcrR family transcriptional regulator [Flavobacterium sp.]|uniref:TetR/AcrR family transcriptional regulator n=1 Tax=Flavobacterium sp. TaxID=239 RepID=UPI0025DD8FD1|nr:TetR/AcrR family transcriptional regulator [Flavobacterium sp.]